eukprot:TRINITY_DN371_c0_g1_i1.p1 TRINITY_DN371_c0_g1~~TRINITY_DN371_c0_g1_i1.p1  ORF type:complete len:170 (-),score=25.72 TRINITY_DN371_c0_g1_i1:182-691(-)
MVRQAAIDAGAFDSVIADHWANGSYGAEALAVAIDAACDANDRNNFRLLYDDSLSLKDKILTICREMYNAADVEYSDIADQRIADYERQGLGGLPICMAKTQYSLTTDAAVKGVPTGHTIRIADVKAAAGAGFIYPLCGTMQTMPGLSTRPVYRDIDLDIESGRILGLF